MGLGGEDGDEHALGEEVGFFDEVDDGESAGSALGVGEAEEEPVVVAVGVEVVFDEEVVFVGLFGSVVGAAEVATFKIRIYPIFSHLLTLSRLLL